MTDDLQRMVRREREKLTAKTKKMAELEQGGEEKEETGVLNYVAHDKAVLKQKSQTLSAVARRETKAE